MLTVHFFKRDGERFLKALHEGKPIDPGGAWDLDKVLALAGACFYAVMKHGPKELLKKAADGEDVPERHAEYQEAMRETFNQELHAGVEFYAQLAMLVHRGAFDESYEPEVGAALTVADGKAQLKPVMGFKGMQDAEGGGVD